MIRRSEPAPLRIEDAMPDFWEFWAAATRRDREEQVTLFRTMVIERHPALYTAKVLLGDERSLEPALTNKIECFLDEAPARVDVMRRLAERLPFELAAHASRFLSTFPDFRYEGAVYLLVSLRSFDGAVRKVGGQPSLLFGVDEIARVHGEDARLTVLFDHELFHIYHAGVFPDWKLEPSPLWHSLWAEGLATHVSATLDAEAPTALILGQPADLEERARPMRAALARELLTKLDSLEKRDYADFFYGDIARTDMPPRSGYYIGLLIARSLAGGVALPDAARWGGEDLRKRIGHELERLSA